MNIFASVFTLQCCIFLVLSAAELPSGTDDTQTEVTTRRQGLRLRPPSLRLNTSCTAPEQQQIIVENPPDTLQKLYASCAQNAKMYAGIFDDLQEHPENMSDIIASLDPNDAEYKLALLEKCFGIITMDPHKQVRVDFSELEETMYQKAFFMAEDGSVRFSDIKGSLLTQNQFLTKELRRLAIENQAIRDGTLFDEFKSTFNDQTLELAKLNKAHKDSALQIKILSTLDRAQKDEIETLGKKQKEAQDTITKNAELIKTLIAQKVDADKAHTQEIASYQNSLFRWKVATYGCLIAAGSAGIVAQVAKHTNVKINLCTIL